VTGQATTATAASEPGPADLEARKLEHQRTQRAYRDPDGGYPDPERHNRLPGVDVRGSIPHRPPV
jgi:hypothetical protein